MKTIFKFKLIGYVLILAFFAGCSDAAPEYLCEPNGKVECEQEADKTPPSEALKKLRSDVVGTWKLYSTRSIDPAWKTDSTYSAAYLKKIPVLCLGTNGILVDNNGRKGKECTYCYSIQQNPASQDSFQIMVGDYAPVGAEPVFTSGQHIACDGDTLFLNTVMDRFIFRHKFVRKK